MTPTHALAAALAAVDPRAAEAWHDTTILLGVVITQGVVLVLGGTKLLVDARQAKASAKSAAESSAEAVELSRPTGNGFASKVLVALQELKDGQEHLREGQERTERKVDAHIEDHAAAHVRGRAR